MTKPLSRIDSDRILNPETRVSTSYCSSGLAPLPNWFNCNITRNQFDQSATTSRGQINVEDTVK